MAEALPIDDALPALAAALRKGPNAVLVAPPGAGKTTRVPLALMDEPWAAGGSILMLEPRRVAARAAAERMAATLGEPVGATVGYRIRGEHKVSAATRIEVVTEGILTRRLQSDQTLEGVAAVILDELHERSIHADLGLALCLDLQSVLRDDLRLLAMSATLEGEAVSAAMGGAPVIRSEGRMHPVETRWLDAPWRGPQAGRDAFERAMAAQVLRALDDEPGDMLAFLPGVAEIERTRALLADAPAQVMPLHGAMPFAKQRAVLRSGDRRRVVLATAIAETSLTIEGVRIVVDGGLARRPVFDPGAGMTRLETGRVSRAAAEQRRGRAGRTNPGTCFRLWTKGEEGALPAREPPSILAADLAPLALELAAWGVDDPAALRWMDEPPPAAFGQARALLHDLGALADGRITAHGRRLAALPTHPRLAHMLAEAQGRGEAGTAAWLAALLEERDPLTGVGADLTLRVEALREPRRFRAERPGTILDAPAARIREQAKRFGGEGEGAVGPLVTLAYPDRIAQRRPGEAPRFVTSGGKGVVLRADDALAHQPFLAVATTDGRSREATIRLAAPISRAEIVALHGDRIVREALCEWDGREKAVRARLRERLGALVLDDRPWKDADATALAAAAAEGVRDLGLAALDWSRGGQRLRDRARWLAEQGEEAPDLSDEALLAALDDWLTPRLRGVRTKDDVASVDAGAALSAWLPWEARERLDRLAPSHLATPAGTRAPIDYEGEVPALEVRIQEMFGEARHPAVLEGRAPLAIRFLSPARRPVQTTGNLPGFWARSYAEVRKDLRGRYPRHPWPEDPLAAQPTSRAKPRR